MTRQEFVSKVNKFIESKYFNYLIFFGGLMNWCFHIYLPFYIFLVFCSFHIIWNELQRESFFPILMVYVVGHGIITNNAEGLCQVTTGIMIYLMLLTDGIKNKIFTLKHPITKALLLIQGVALLSIIPSLILAPKSSIYVIADVGRMILWILLICYLAGWVKDQKKARLYLAHSFFVLLLCISLEMICYGIKIGSFRSIFTDGKSIDLGWTVSTHVAMVFCFAFPFVAYLYQQTKKIIYLVLGCTALFFSIVLRCRGAIFAGSIMLVLVLIFLLLHKTKKLKMQVILSVFIPALALIVIGSITGVVQIIVEKLMERGLDSSHRFDLYELAWTQFLKSPILGTGSYTSQYYIDMVNGGVNHYHNIFMQFLSCTGIIGLGTFIYYLFTLLKLTCDSDPFHRIVFIVIIYLLCHGLIDTTFYNDMIMMFLALICPLVGNFKQNESKTLPFVYNV